MGIREDIEWGKDRESRRLNPRRKDREREEERRKRKKELGE